MVTRRHGLDDGRAPFCKQPGEQDTRLDLRARDGRFVFDARELPSLDRQRQPAFARFHVRSHLGERQRHALHRPGPQRLVAGQLEAATRLTREQTRQQAGQRAGVAAVDGRTGLL